MPNNKRIVSIFVSLLILGGLFTGGCVDEREIFEDLDSSQAVKLMQRYKNSPNFIILDVRTPAEFKGGHLEGAININIRDGRFRDELLKLDKNKIYLVYCRSGRRSAKAVAEMKEEGFKKIFHYSFGIIGWRKDALPLAKD